MESDNTIFGKMIPYMDNFKYYFEYRYLETIKVLILRSYFTVYFKIIDFISLTLKNPGIP